MEKINIGVYVRTKDGYISQYKYYDTTNIGKLLCIPLSNGTFANIEDIVKASYNIIDILEIGDYVNGCYVDEILSENDCWNDKKHFHLLKFNSYFSEVDIKSIVTKEQMEQMEYKVGE